MTIKTRNALPGLTALAAVLALGGCVTTTTPTVVDTPSGPVVSQTTVTVPAWSTVAVKTAPPAAVVETQGNAPYPNAVWIPGYYTYSNGSYVWVQGKWDHDRSGYHWVPASWEQRADGWYYREGYWAN